jgi:hypothetical protein
MLASKPTTVAPNLRLAEPHMITLTDRSASPPKVLSYMICVAALAHGPSALAQGSSIPYSMGARGHQRFEQFQQDRDAFAKTGQPFKIEGHCQSACTLFLKLKSACIDPNAELLFHAGGSKHSTQVMLNAYNSKLRSFLLTNHYMDTPQFHSISGREMIERFGYRRCPGT